MIGILSYLTPINPFTGGIGMVRWARTWSTAILLTIAVAAWLLTGIGSRADAQSRAGASVGVKLVKAPAVGPMNQIRKLIVVVQPVGVLHSQVLEDALAAELMSAAISVISRETRVSVELERQSEAARSSEKETEVKKKDGGGPLEIAKIAGAEAIVTVTVLADVIQRNLYDGQTGRVTEVRSEQVVRGISCTVVRVGDGKLLAVGARDYSGNDSGVPIASVADEWGKALVQLFR